MPRDTSKDRWIDWEEFDGLANQLAAKIDPNEFDLFIVVSRGGLIPGGILSKRVPFFDITIVSIQYYDGKRKLDKPRVLQFPHESLLSEKRVLIIDEVWQSGDTLAWVKKMCTRAGAVAKVATIHFKPKFSENDGRPDYYVEEENRWVHYPWEKAEGQT